MPFAVAPGQPSGYLQYDSQQYRVFTEEQSGTLVEVAVHEQLTEGALISGFPAIAPKSFAQLVFDIFSQHHRVFGGYAYDRYLVVVRGPGDDPLGAWSRDRVGLDIALGNYLLGSAAVVEPPHGFTSPFAQDWVAHEMFHSWNGDTIARAVWRQNMVYQPETWFAEGVTVYYTARTYPGDAAFYQEMMEDAADSYREADASLRDLSFLELAEATPPWTGNGAPPFTDAVELLYQKGALVGFLLDQELRRHGSTMDNFMQYLYVNFGLAGRPYTNQDLLAAATTVAGGDMADFFQRYVWGNDPLPLDETLEFLP